MKIDYKCKNCKDDGIVVWDAWASWDVEKQECRLESTYDHFECTECGDTDIEEIEV